MNLNVTINRPNTLRRAVRHALHIGMPSLLLAVGLTACNDDDNETKIVAVQPADNANAGNNNTNTGNNNGNTNTTPANDMGRTDPMMDGPDSEQPGTDTWITTKVKSSLLADSDVSGLDIEVETVNGVVTLSGQVDQQMQIDEATRIAREIEGVTDVRTTALTVGAN